MLSVIIPTRNSDRVLVPTLAALVPGATAGLITEVLVADAGSQDETAAVADIAGCNFAVVEGPLGRRLKAAAALARAPWLMFLRPDTVLDAPWTGEVERFVQ
jgi:glycosyltransferase involved in cell wall biosynthesis